MEESSHLPSQFIRPPVLNNESGNMRSIGVEFEFSSVDLDQAGVLIRNRFDGDISKISTYKYEVKDTTFGTFILILDARVVRDKKYEPFLRKIGLEPGMAGENQVLENKIKELASTIVPYEIVTPPIPFTHLNQLDWLIEDLRLHNAQGTGKSIINAFGLHLNVEAPSLASESLLRHLKAFLLLEPWIRNDSQIDLTRRLTPYIDEFQSPYVNLVLKQDYNPSMNELIDDYLTYNPTRNKSLDMLPIFMHKDTGRVTRKITDQLTSPRPAYHYRLPNSHIDKPHWSLALEWNRWVLVEMLAEDRDTLRHFCKEYLTLRDEVSLRFHKVWGKKINQWVTNVRS